MAGPVRPGTKSARRTRRENSELKWGWWRLCDDEDGVRLVRYYDKLSDKQRLYSFVIRGMLVVSAFSDAARDWQRMPIIGY